MTYAITQSCCNDASCLSVCPVNCIHPTPEEPDFGKTDVLHIDPRACIDCGACADACPVDAIYPVTRLPASQQRFAAVNADYFAGKPVDPLWDAPVFPLAEVTSVGRLEVAVVGTGPAACYAAQDVLRNTAAHVTMYDKSSVPGGLARFGVAPDHTSTRRIGEHFRHLFRNPRVTMRLGVDVRARPDGCDAVIWAVGAAGDRPLGVPGEEHSLSARSFVAWYNGHPDAPDVRLDVERVVVLGNGNVALDVARLLTCDPESLAGTEIAPRALAELRSSRVQEVVVVGRRGPTEAAFSPSECLALRHLSGVSVVVEGEWDLTGTALEGLPAPAAAGRRIVFVFGRPVARVLPDGVAFADGVIEAGLVLRAIGYRGTPQDGLPHDALTGVVPNLAGRVQGLPGQYVVGWAKRGPQGGIGANKNDAQETVRALIEDAAAGRLRSG